MLPVVATMVMGTLSKQTDGGAQLRQQAQSSGPNRLISSLLDSDRYGSVPDDVLDLAKRFSSPAAVAVSPRIE